MVDIGRIQREIEHDRRIADRAEIVWNWDNPSGRRRADRRATLFVEHGALGAGVRALELGCGTGVFLERVAASGCDLHGIDVSVDLLRRAQARAQRFERVRLGCADAHRMPYADGTFDTVYGSSVLHHLDLDAALREVLRVLRPGGRIVFAEPNIVNPQVAFMFNVGLTKDYFGVSPDERAFSRFAARRALERAGYTDVSVRPFDFLHPATPVAWLDTLARVGRSIEAVPLVREIAGSLLICARRAGGGS